MPGRELKFAAVTDVGRERDHNEDNFLVDKKLGLFVVCDGMGGHAAGEVASALAVRTLHEEVKREIELIQDFEAGQRGAALVTKRDLLNMLEFAVNRASRRIHAEAQLDTSHSGMGTTLVALLVVGTQAFMVHVGDSRIYLLRDGTIEQLTEDHTAHNELIKRRKMTREQAEKLVQRSAITRAVGVYEHVEPDSLVMDLSAGDRFLLCSDGLSTYFEGELQMAGTLLAQADEAQAAQKLVAFANERGGTDNITAVVVTIGDVNLRDQAHARELQLQRETLANAPLFRQLNDREILRLLQVTEISRFTAGDAVIREGDSSEDLFVVLRGAVRLLRGNREVGRILPGDFFGELALIRNQPRSASAYATEDTELIALKRSDFLNILRKEPPLATKLLWQLAVVLSDRLLETTRALEIAQEGLADDAFHSEIPNEVFYEDEEENRHTLVMPPPAAVPHSLED